MAGKSKFRIPTLTEMEKSDDKLAPVFSVYKQNTSSSGDAKTEKPDTSKEKSHQKPPPVPPQPEPLVKSVSSETPTSSNTLHPTSAKAQPENSVLNTNAAKAVSVAKPETAKQNQQTNSTASEIPATKQSSNSIIVNSRQRGNPILKGIRNVPWEFGNIIPDYVMGKASCALFLSLRYHQLHPEYIHTRLKSLGKSFDLRVMLVQVDVKDPHHLLKELSKVCILAECTLILAFSPEEAGRYLETYKVYENKPPDMIMEKSEHDYMSKVTDCLTSVKSVNKTDCVNLISSFKSLEAIINCSRDSLLFCPGLGPRKAQRLYEVFHEPFVRKRKHTSNEHLEGESPKKAASS